MTAVVATRVEWGFLVRPALHPASRDDARPRIWRIWQIADLVHDVQCCQLELVDRGRVIVVFTHHSRLDAATVETLASRLTSHFDGSCVAFVRDVQPAATRVTTRDARHTLVAAAVAIASASGTLDDLTALAVQIDEQTFQVAPSFADGRWRADVVRCAP